MESLLHLDAALARLTHLRMVARIPRALDHLVELQQQTQLLTLYQHYFPREWAQSRTELQPKPDYLYSPRELEFTKLVYPRMFALDYWDLYEMAGGFEERLPFVPLEYTALQLWAVEPEHLSFSVRVLASMLYGEVWGSWETLLARAGISTMLDTVRATFSTDIGFDWHRLRNLSRRAGKPLAWLPDALSALVACDPVSSTGRGTDAVHRVQSCPRLGSALCSIVIPGKCTCYLMRLYAAGVTGDQLLTFVRHGVKCAPHFVTQCIHPVTQS